MTPKDNIIETVPLSAIRKVIELDAQDAHELRTLAVQMRDALNQAQFLHHYIQGSDRQEEILAVIQAALKKAKAIL